MCATRRTADTFNPPPDTSPPEPDVDRLVSPELTAYAAFEDTAAAVEVERRRLADLLETAVIEPITLLLSQASVYEQTLGSNPQARMAVSVLASLARQAIQQTRDLRTNLHPTLLESLGLELALESLAGQIMRASGLQIRLHLVRLPKRLPVSVELAFFRAVQEAFDRALQQAHASELELTLALHDHEVVLSLADNGRAPTAADGFQAVRQRIRQIGGQLITRIGPQGGLELTIRFAVQPPIHLTERESEVLQLVARGLSNKAIAGALALSPRTINFHLDNIYAKLAVRSRTEAAIVAMRQGLIQRPPSDPG